MNSPTISPAPVRKSLVVKADVHRSFTTFTNRMGSWWPRSKSVGASPQVDVVIEPRAGGRWYERGQDGAECEWGKVLHWDPPVRLILAWQIDGNWKYNPACVTEVEINFTTLAMHCWSRITGSIGSAQCPSQGSSTDGLYKAADTALNDAKRSGRNKWSWYGHVIKLRSMPAPTP